MRWFFLLSACFYLLSPSSSEAAYLFKNGKLIKSEEVATFSVQEHYGLAMQAYQDKNWDELVHQSLIIIKNFETTPFAIEAYYYLGSAYFHMEEYEYSNRFLTKYLKKQITPKFFEEAITYKFRIAEQYRLGERKHLFGIDTFPKWLPAAQDAIVIYDEVITALPHHDLAASALFGKAYLQLKDQEYKSSIETYQMLIRRFPKHPLARESYIGIGDVYLIQAQESYPDQDFLDLAELNVRKFRADFPSDDKVQIAEDTLAKMKEVYASDLYDIARFYERTKKPHAARIYYNRIQAKYPQTKTCELAAKRLARLPSISQEVEIVPSQKGSSPTHKEEHDESPLLKLKPQGWTVEAERETLENQ